MKAIKFLLSAVVAVMVMSLAACSNSNPAKEYAEALDKVSVKINDLQNINDFATVIPEIQNIGKITKDNADYTLTDSDKDALKKAMENYITVSMNKTAEMYGVELSDQQVEMMKQMISQTIDNAKTLGDLGNPEGGDMPTEIETDLESAVEADMVEFGDSIAE